MQKKTIPHRKDELMNQEIDMPVKVGISRCLLGEPVRYDSGHKLDRFLRDTVGRFVQWVPVCPEVECGLPVPREAMHLIGNPENPRLVTVRSKLDLTEKMVAWTGRKTEELSGEQLCGFVFKARSPSSGMQGIKIYDENTGQVRHYGAGLFARAFMARFGLVPAEDDGRLHDMGLRENFIERVFVMARWYHYVNTDGTVKGLIGFHTDHKLLVMAHSPEMLKKLGKMAAMGAKKEPEDLKNDYIATLMEALKQKATIGKNTNVLHHCMGYFKKRLSADQKKELGEVISEFHGGLVPLLVPVTLIRHYVRLYQESYLMRQWYLNPHPRELMLRNHV